MHKVELAAAQREGYLQWLEGWSQGAQEFWEEMIDRMMLPGGIYEDMYIWSSSQE